MAARPGAGKGGTRASKGGTTEGGAPTSDAADTGVPDKDKPAGAKSGGGKALTNEELLSVWSKAVDTQMHFNEMAVKSRQLGLTFVAAALGTAVVLLGQGKDFSLLIGGWRLHITVLLLLAALAALHAVRTLDLGVYHQMLRGAVAFGRDLERQRLANLLGLNKGMTDAIAHFSRSRMAQAKGSPLIYTGAEDTTAGDKIARFYNLTTGFLVLAAIVLFLLTNWATVETPRTAADTRVGAGNAVSSHADGDGGRNVSEANSAAPTNQSAPRPPATNVGESNSGNRT